MFCQCAKSVIIRIIPVPAVSFFHKGITAAHPARCVGKPDAVTHHILFIWHGDIHALKLCALKKVLETLRLNLIELVLIVCQHTVKLRRVAVGKLPAQ